MEEWESKFCEVVNVNVIISNISICHDDGRWQTFCCLRFPLVQNFILFRVRKINDSLIICKLYVNSKWKNFSAFLELRRQTLLWNNYFLRLVTTFLECYSYLVLTPGGSRMWGINVRFTLLWSQNYLSPNFYSCVLCT